MFSSGRLIALLERRVLRRLIITPLVMVAMVIGVVLSPLWLLGAALSDRVAGRERRPRFRLVVLIIGALIIETIGIVTSLVLWIMTGFGLLGSRRWRWHMHRGFMGRYTAALLWLITRILGTKVDWRDHAELANGPVVLVARHTSFFDALIPATVLSRRNKLLAHHVVTRGLRYSPCIDIVGHRFPNRFIQRTPSQGSNELAHIRAVGNELDERSAAIIFPEGTFRNPDRFERAVRRIRRRHSHLADRAAAMNHVLPPRASGTLALLEGTPGADVVVCANTGFEPFGSIKDIVDRPYSDTTIIVETWRVARAQIPNEPDAFAEWLLDEYTRIDTWVERVSG